MNALRELIERRLGERGWSYAEAARRAGLPRSTVHHLATTEVVRRMPQLSTLRALAQGLELPQDLVHDAAAAAAGIQVYRERGQDPDVAVLIASLERLSPEDRRHVTALVESLARSATAE